MELQKTAIHEVGYAGISPPGGSSQKHERHEIKQKVALTQRIAHQVAICRVDFFEFFRVFRAFRGQFFLGL